MRNFSNVLANKSQRWWPTPKCSPRHQDCIQQDTQTSLPLERHHDRLDWGGLRLWVNPWADGKEKYLNPNILVINTCSISWRHFSFCPSSRTTSMQTPRLIRARRRRHSRTQSPTLKRRPTPMQVGLWSSLADIIIVSYIVSMTWWNQMWNWTI